MAGRLQWQGWTREAAIRIRARPAAVMKPISAWCGDRRPIFGMASGIKRCEVDGESFRMVYRGSRVMDVFIQGRVEGKGPDLSVLHLRFDASSWWLKGTGLVAVFAVIQFWSGKLTAGQAVGTMLALAAFFAASDLLLGPAIVMGRISRWLAKELGGEVME
jgi:hypothetical protein